MKRKEKVKAKPRNPRLQLLHEFDNKRAKHRLVIVKEGEQPDYSAWFSTTEVGSYKGYFFCDHGVEYNMKAGVWRQAMQESKILDGRRYGTTTFVETPQDIERKDG